MKLFRKIDENGLFLEDVLLDAVPYLTEKVQDTITNEDGTTTTLDTTHEEIVTEVVTENIETQELNEETGEYVTTIETVEKVVSVLNPYYIETHCPEGFYLPKWNGTEWVEGGEIPTRSVEDAKQSKIADLSDACQQTIYTGVDVETTIGIEHFSLQITDQIEITNQYNKVIMGATEALYHADGNGGNCRLFSAAEIIAIATKATEFVTYNKTYFNELKAWVNRCATVDEVNAVSYGSPLPTDLDEHMLGLIGVSSISL